MVRTLVAGLAALVACAGSVTAQTSPEYHVQPLGGGIFALLRTDPPGLMFEANSTLLIGARDVVVVDPGSNPASAREVLRVLRELTPLPVTHIVNTHWHDDHILGNEVFLAAFPDAQVIAHRTAAEDEDGDGLRFRQSMIDNGPGTIRYLQQLMADGRGMQGGTMSDAERASHNASIALAEKAIRQLPHVRTVKPTRVVDEQLTLHAAGRTIELRHVGRAHTRGDLLVFLPAERILIAGDVIAGPIPLVGSTSFPLEFGATVAAALALGPTVIIPGHGPVHVDRAYPDALLRLLDTLRTQVLAAVARGETLEQARQSVDLGAHRAALAGTDPVLQLLFDSYVAQPGIARAYEAARAEK